MIPGSTYPSRCVIFSLEAGSESKTSVKMPSFTLKHFARSDEAFRVAMKKADGLETQYNESRLSLRKKLATSAMNTVLTTARAVRPLDGDAICSWR